MDPVRSPSSIKAGKACWIVLTFMVFVFLGGLYLGWRFLVDSPVTYANIEEHFKYGSTGGERQAGIPFWIWKALPVLCADKLPGEGYASLGFLYEDNRPLPIGVSQRKVMGLNRVFLNCAVCHTGTVRDTPSSLPRVHLGMPANNIDLMNFEKFVFACAEDPKFTPSRVIPIIQSLGADLDIIDRYVVYPLAIYIVRDGLMTLGKSFEIMLRQPDWGPGRVDTFSSAKALFSFPMDNAPDQELVGVADLPSIWNQQQRKDMHLHWDGNNKKVEERNKSAAFGTGATPPTIDHKSIERIEDWLLTHKPPSYPYFIDWNLAAKGALVYKEYCASCHGTSGQDFHGELVGTVIPIEDINTDPHRLDSYTYELAVNQGMLYAGYDKYRFRHFRKTFGYAAMPLDGLWLRAPYLHNGSVPTLRDLLEPRSRRPKEFYRGSDVYDPVKVGFRTDIPEEKGRPYFKFRTEDDGNSNQGHEGKRYGTELTPDLKEALIEYLKGF